ncbi:MAG: hypothetical protein OYH77_06640 [Pseudomonadota bacterium]|nr:hypothetical protein [Pseudomonadota bacterium]
MHTLVLCLLLCLTTACALQRREVVIIEGDNNLVLDSYLDSVRARYSLIYQQGKEIELRKLPNGFRYDLIADPAGMSVSARMVGETVVYTLKPTAAGFTSVVFVVLDNRNRQAAIVDAGVSVKLADNYQLEAGKPMIFKTFQEVEFSYNHEHVAINRVGECQESIIHNCVSTYRLITKSKEATKITFDDDIATYSFAVNM